MKEEDRLLITGTIGIMVIVSLIVFVNSHPLTGAISYTTSGDFSTKRYPCSTLKGYCYDDKTNSICSFQNDGWCPRSCECRLY